MTLHAVIYRYTDEPARLDEHRPLHKSYLASLFEQQRIVVSGPFTDGAPGALLIMDADNADQVRALLDLDPFWELGLIADRQIRQWSPFFGAARVES